MKNRYPLIFITSVILIAIFGYLFLQSSMSSGQDTQAFHKVTQNKPTKPKLLYGVPIDSMQIVKAVVKANENLSEILGRYNVSAATIYQIGTLPKETFDVRKLQANKNYTIIHGFDSSQTAKSFIYHPNPIDYVVFRFDDSLKVEKGQNRVDTIKNEISGIIKTSLYQAIMDVEESPVLVSELADVYAWAIDFFGLQTGDSFKAMYTTYEVDGQPAGFGNIITASFTHMDKEFLAYSFDQGEGVEFFDEEGNSLRKTFLKAPLNFTRISSRFSYSRLHPVLKYRRPHLGVDYAAPSGTPVQAVGDGEVITAAYSGGAGKMVKIKHNSNYTTAYLHLSGYGKGVKAGAHVRQGDIIGYVGSTGLSTGPHLDFRFYKNGVPVDPLKVDPPSANPITEAFKAEFEKEKSRQQEILSKIKIIPSNQELAEN